MTSLRRNHAATARQIAQHAHTLKLLARKAASGDWTPRDKELALQVMARSIALTAMVAADLKCNGVTP